ncbi:MAG: dienelactone hydrolase family protein [Candidatus Obscuribacterales bacterium]|nr:dienelactone hydrolase family protein [Steroidobacteraceae bacterium]
MCDDNSIEDMIDATRRADTVSRRQFGSLAVGSSLIALLPRAVGAVAVKEADVEIKTPDGVADAYFVHPASGKHPAVLIWPDIFGLRPAFKQMGKRLAESGYSVLVVNPFYRTKKAPVAAEGANFQDPATRSALMALAGALNAETAVTDAKAFVAYLDSQSSVDKKRKMGTTGYCMGGPITMRTAASLPDRIGAAGSFHGGGLVTDKPESPHLLVPKMKASYLIAIAENDDARQPDAKDVLRETFAKAKLPAEIEVYKGAQHGWCPPDAAVYNKEQAERAWDRLLVLFKTALA